MTLTELSGGTGSSDSSAIILEEDLIIGEKIFGVRLGRKAMMGLAVALFVIVVTASVIFIQQMMKPGLEKQQQQMRHRYLNREGG